MLDNYKKNYFKFNRQDMLFIVLLAGIIAWFIFNASYIGRNPTFDMNSYIKLAENPISFSDRSIPGIHAQRIFGPILVWCLKNVLSISIDTAFRIVSDFSFVAFVFLFYSILRGAKVVPMIAFGTTVFSMISCWPATYSLANIYQVCDAMTYPLMLIMIILTVKRKINALFLVSMAGVLTRQPLFVMAFCSFLYLYTQDRKWRNILYFVFIAILFLYTSLFAGYKALDGLLCCMVTNGKFSNILIGIKETQLPLLFSPFLLIFFNKDIFGYVKKYWWVALYAIIVIGSPFYIYFETLQQNVVRQIFQGIMPTFLLAGLLLNDTLKQFRVKLIYCILPFAYGLLHLSFIKNTYAPLVGHRYVMIFIMFLLVLWSRRMDRKI